MKGGINPEVLEYLRNEFPDPKQLAHFIQTHKQLEAMGDLDKAKFKEIVDKVEMGYGDPKEAAAISNSRMGLFSPNTPPENHPLVKSSAPQSELEYPLEFELQYISDDILKLPRELLNANNHDSITLADINKKLFNVMILEEFKKKFKKDIPLLTKYAKNEQKLKFTETYLFLYIFIRIINTYHYLLMHNPEHLLIAKSFEETFVEIQRILSKANLKHTILHDLVSGFIVTLDRSIVNNQIVKAKKTDVPEERQKMIVEAAFLAQLGEQRARSMQSGMLNDRYFEGRRNYDLGFSGALIEGDISLNHISMAKKRLEDLYQNILSRAPLRFTPYNHTFLLYLDKLASLELTDAVLQQRLLWSRRMHPVLDPTDTKVPDTLNFQREQNKARLGADIKKLYSIFKERLSEKLNGFTTLKYDPKTDALEYTFPRELSKEALQKLERAFQPLRPKLNFMISGNNKLVLKNVISIRLDKLDCILNESFNKFIDQGELAIARDLKIAQKKKQSTPKKAQSEPKKELEKKSQGNAQTESQKELNLAPATQRVQTPVKADNTVGAAADAVEKLSLRGTTQLAVQKPKRKDQPQPLVPKQTEVIKNTGKALGLKNEAYNNLLFKKLENATGIFVAFENEFAIGHGAPNKELIQRFRDTICEVPVRVPPQGKNGFKWVDSESKVLLFGKLKKEKFRLRPIYSEVTKEGKTVFVYGTITDTKSGKKINQLK